MAQGRDFAHKSTCACAYPFKTGKLIEIEHQSSLHTTMRPGWEDLVRRCLQMFLNHSEGQPWSCKRHYQEGRHKSMRSSHLCNARKPEV